jgi:biotin carboxylase
MHEALAAGGVPVAGGVTFDLARRTATPLAHAADRVGFPAVLKPVNGSGSLLVRRVDDAAALRRVLDEYAERGPVADVGRLVGTRLRLEPYLSGPEISVEGHVSGGAATIVAFTRKQLGPEPHFVEVGHVVQAALTPAERAAATAVTHRAVAALGLDTAVFHLELRLTARGPVVIEVGARLGGDRIHRLVRLATGFSLPEAAVRLLTGLPAPAPPPDTALRAAGIRLFTVREPARLPDPAALRARLAALPGCAEAEVSCAPEAELRPATDFRGRFGHVILTAPDHTALTAALAEADALVSAALAAPDGGTAGADPDDRPARPARPAGEAVPCAS